MKKRNNQLVGNIGLFYVCYKLSKKGWNCLPTTRNAKGVDIVIYSQDGKKKYTIEVKSLSGINPVPFGSKRTIMSDFVVICRNVLNNPEIFILTREEVKDNLRERKKGNRTSYWLKRQFYENEKFKDKWDRIGKGFTNNESTTY